MLFAIKKHLLPTLLLWVSLTIGALLARHFLDLEWSMQVTQDTWWQVLFGLAAIGASDGLLFGLLWLIAGEQYLQRYTAFADYFSSQGAPEIAAAGLLASSEEWLFRGIVLQALISLGNTSPLVAVVLSALLFGLCHIIRERSLEPFALWAVWEGVLLGVVYLMSGSLLVSMLVHALHDIGGFTLFAFQRRTGWLLAQGWGSSG